VGRSNLGTERGNGRKMRIAFVAQPFDRLNPPVQGGSLAIWIYQVARICARQGQETFIFANHGPAWRSTTKRAENIDYVYTPTGLNRLMNKVLGAWCKGAAAAGLDRPYLPRFSSAWQDLGYALEVGRRLRHMECDVVHVMNYSQFVPILRKLNPTCRICLHMACEWLNQLDYKTIKGRIAQADLIMGCSEHITDKIAKRFPEFKERCVTVHNGAEVVPERCRNILEPGFVLFVGRVSPEKGLHDLVKAFKIVLNRFPEAQLHIVGGVGSAPMELLVGLSDEPHVADLRVFYEQPGKGGKDPYAVFLEQEAGEELGRRIFFDGRIAYDQVNAFYKRAGILVNPSLSEAFGMSLVEAMMHSVPVVATRIGGMTNIVDHGRTGLLVEPANPTALAAGICELLKNPDRSLKMGDAGRRKAIEQFSWEKVTGDLLGHFSSLVGGGDRKK